MKGEFFFRQKRLIEWLEEHDVLGKVGLEGKTSARQYVSLWVNDHDLPPRAKAALDHVGALALQDPWMFCEPPKDLDDLVPRAWWHETLGLDMSRSRWERINTDPLTDEKAAEVLARLEDYRKRLRGVCTMHEWDARLAAAYEQEEEYPEYQGYRRDINRLGVNVRHVTDADCIVPHDKRRDPEAYRDAKRCAELLGRQVAFADPAPRDDARQEPGATHLETDDHFYLLPGKLTPREYQRLTTKARASGKEVVMLRSWDGAPQPIQDAVANPS